MSHPVTNVRDQIAVRLWPTETYKLIHSLDIGTSLAFAANLVIKHVSNITRHRVWDQNTQRVCLHTRLVYQVNSQLYNTMYPLYIPNTHLTLKQENR